MIKAIIFDVDGTLAETEELHRAAFNRTFKKWGLNWYWDTKLYAELLKISGGKERLRYYRSLNPSTALGSSEKAIAQIHKEKTLTYVGILDKTKLYPRPELPKTCSNYNKYFIMEFILLFFFPKDCF